MKLTEQERDELAEDIALRILRAIARNLTGAALGPPAAPAAPPGPPTPPPRWMTIKDYAQSRGYSQRTIQAWIGEGLPVVGAQRARRVVVADADAWIAARPRKG